MTSSNLSWALRGAAVAFGLSVAAPATAWSPAAQVAVAREAARLAPADLGRQIARHRGELERGAVAPFSGTDPLLHVREPGGAGKLDRAIVQALDDLVAAIRAPMPFADVVYRAGVLSHYVADINNPLNTSNADPAEGRYFADYLRYMESAEPRFALVFYGKEPPVDDRQGLRVMLARALARGRELYPLIGLEYRRTGFGAGVERFDDRSTAFGIAALSFSHAVSDVARALRLAWLEAGGSDAGSLARREHEALLQIPRAAR